MLRALSTCRSAGICRALLFWQGWVEEIPPQPYSGRQDDCQSPGGVNAGQPSKPAHLASRCLGLWTQGTPPCPQSHAHISAHRSNPPNPRTQLSCAPFYCLASPPCHPRSTQGNGLQHRDVSHEMYTDMKVPMPVSTQRCHKGDHPHHSQPRPTASRTTHCLSSHQTTRVHPHTAGTSPLHHPQILHCPFIYSPAPRTAGGLCTHTGSTRHKRRTLPGSCLA